MPVLSKPSLPVLSKPSRPDVTRVGNYVMVVWKWQENNDGAHIVSYVIKHVSEGEGVIDDFDSEDAYVVDSKTNFLLLPCDWYQDSTNCQFAVKARYSDGHESEFSDLSDDVRTSPGKQCCECDY